MEDLSYSSQLFLGEGSGELVFVRDMGSYVLLGAQFSRLVVGDELAVELGPEDTLRRSEVVVVGVIRHGRVRCSGGKSGRRGDGVLAHRCRPYMSSWGGP